MNSVSRCSRSSLSEPLGGLTPLNGVQQLSYDSLVLRSRRSLPPHPQDAPTVSEFLDIFDSPINVDLESEQVWPMPPPLKY